MDSFLCFFQHFCENKQTNKNPGVPLLFVFVLEHSQQIRFFCFPSLANGFPRHRWWQITRNDIWNLTFTFSFDQFHSFIKVLMMAKAAIYQNVPLVSAYVIFFCSFHPSVLTGGPFIIHQIHHYFNTFSKPADWRSACAGLLCEIRCILCTNK